MSSSQAAWEHSGSPFPSVRAAGSPLLRWFCVNALQSPWTEPDGRLRAFLFFANWCSFQDLSVQVIPSGNTSLSIPDVGLAF